MFIKKIQLKSSDCAYYDSLSIVLIAMLQREYSGIKRTSNSTKIILFTLFMTSYLLFIHYSTLFISLMTVPTPAKPIKELRLDMLLILGLRVHGSGGKKKFRRRGENYLSGRGIHIFDT